MGALQALVAPVSRKGRFFSHVRVSGSHIASLELLKAGAVHVAAIDSVTYSLLELYRPTALQGLRKLGRTHHAPGVPYVTHGGFNPATIERMRAAVFRAFADPNLQGVRQTLLLDDIEFLPIEAYERIATDRDTAAGYGFSLLN